MTNQEAVELSTKLSEIYQELCCPFPSEECRFLKKTTPKVFDGFLPTFDYYDTIIAGYGSSGRRIFRWHLDKIEECALEIQLGFFDRFPQYSQCEYEITAEKTPKLFARLNSLNQIRAVLSQLIPYLQRSEQARIG